MSRELLVAEDDPGLAETLREYLEGQGMSVRVTSSADVARQWLQGGASAILDGSIVGQMGIPLRMLPTKRVIIWSGDTRLVREARQLGLSAFCKGCLQNFEGLLREVVSRDFASVLAD